MFCKTTKRAALLLLLATITTACSDSHDATPDSFLPAVKTQEATARPVSTVQQPSPAAEMSAFAFPGQIDPTKRYLFYLHGRIIEDQGIRAVSPRYGAYEYREILEEFQRHGFVVISEHRGQNTDPYLYATRIVRQVESLLNSGVPEGNVTIVGASKGAVIAIFVSHLLEIQNINYVIIAICTPDVREELIESNVSLSGNVLSIYDSIDEFAGSCEELFILSQGEAFGKHDEIVLDLGLGHGMLYHAMDEWMLPVLQWTGMQ